MAARGSSTEELPLLGSELHRDGPAESWNPGMPARDETAAGAEPFQPESAEAHGGAPSRPSPAGEKRKVDI